MALPSSDLKSVFFFLVGFYFIEFEVLYIYLYKTNAVFHGYGSISDFHPVEANRIFTYIFRKEDSVLE